VGSSLVVALSGAKTRASDGPLHVGELVATFRQLGQILEVRLATTSKGVRTVILIVYRPPPASEAGVRIFAPVRPLAPESARLIRGRADELGVPPGDLDYRDYFPNFRKRSVRVPAEAGLVTQGDRYYANPPAGHFGGRLIDLMGPVCSPNPASLENGGVLALVVNARSTPQYDFSIGAQYVVPNVVATVPVRVLALVSSLKLYTPPERVSLASTPADLEWVDLGGDGVDFHVGCVVNTTNYLRSIERITARGWFRTRDGIASIPRDWATSVAVVETSDGHRYAWSANPFLCGSYAPEACGPLHCPVVLGLHPDVYDTDWLSVRALLLHVVSLPAPLHAGFTPLPHRPSIDFLVSENTFSNGDKVWCPTVRGVLETTDGWAPPVNLTPAVYQGTAVYDRLRAVKQGEHTLDYTTPAILFSPVEIVVVGDRISGVVYESDLEMARGMFGAPLPVTRRLVVGGAVLSDAPSVWHVPLAVPPGCAPWPDVLLKTLATAPPTGEATKRIELRDPFDGPTISIPSHDGTSAPRVRALDPELVIQRDGVANPVALMRVSEISVAFCHQYSLP